MGDLKFFVHQVKKAPKEVKEQNLLCLQKMVEDYCKSRNIWNFTKIFTYKTIEVNGNKYASCNFIADEKECSLVQVDFANYILVINGSQRTEGPSVNVCLDYIYNQLWEEPQVKQEPTIHFDKKVLESGLSFKEAYMRMVEGKKISRPCFMGWWFMNHESKVIIHDRYANELKEGDITNTVTNTLANDWEVIE